MRDRDEAEFCAFVAGRTPALLRTALLLTGDRGLAEDAVQVALTKTYLAWGKIERRESAEAYTRRVILRDVLSWRRRRASTELVTHRLPERPGPDDANAQADRDLLWQALLTLPPRQRAVIVLRYYEDLSEREVATLLGCAVGTVKSHSARALATLRSALVSTATTTEQERT